MRQWNGKLLLVERDNLEYAYAETEVVGFAMVGNEEMRTLRIAIQVLIDSLSRISCGG
jgi:hypothetical protein